MRMKMSGFFLTAFLHEKAFILVTTQKKKPKTNKQNKKNPKETISLKVLEMSICFSK